MIIPGKKWILFIEKPLEILNEIENKTTTEGTIGLFNY